jgi:hypothetical protein
MEDPLRILLDTYTKEEPTTRDYLDARYFDIMFSDFGGYEAYPGYVKQPLVFRFVEDNFITNDKGVASRDFELKQIVGDAMYLNLIPETPDIVRMVIEVQRKGKSELTSRHSNLLIVDPNKLRVYRFEPMKFHSYYTEVIDNALKQLISQSLPNYELRHVSAHPQMEMRNKGFCVAYVLKFAAMYILGETPIFSDDPLDIMRFATAVEKMYGLELMRRYGKDSLSDKEFGEVVETEKKGGNPLKRAAVGAGAGFLLGNLPGAVIGATLGVATTPATTKVVYTKT